MGSRIQRSGPQRTRPYNRRYSGLGDTSVLPSQVLCSFLVLCLCKQDIRFLRTLPPPCLHPLILHRRLRAGSPICIVGPAVESKAAKIELSGSESCDGWKWLTISLYASGNPHAYCKWKEIQAVVGFPEKLPVKMPNYLNVDQGGVKSPTTVSLLGLLLKCFGLFPKQPDGENSEVPGDLVWILICTCLPGLPFHCSAPAELVSVGVLFTGPKAELKDYIEQVQAMYASGDRYVVKWKEW